MQKRRLPRLKKPDMSNPRAIKLSISVGIFLALALIKLFDPNGAERMGGAINGYIGDKTPVTIEALGRAVTESDSLIAVFRNLSGVLTGKSQEVTASGEDNVTVPDAVTAEDVTVPAAEDNEETASPEPVLSAAALQTTSLISRSMPWRGGQIEVVTEDELDSGGDFGVDDTLPLPFGYDAPPNVDYTQYVFGFEYASPVEGVKSSGFGYRLHPIKNETLFHYGTDFAAGSGTEIKAFADGTVAAVGANDSYGNYLLINHGDGVSSFYAHCSKLLVKEGAAVKLGQVVAKVGSTGLSTGPHLHFELRRDGKILDPEYYL